MVAAMAGILKWSDAEQTDKVEFLVAESDCNNLDQKPRFDRHKVLLCQVFRINLLIL